MTDASRAAPHVRCVASATLGLLCIATLLAATPAFAHHPTGGMTPTTVWHGLLSGFGHPVIGIDHLAFIVATGIAAALLPGGLAIPVGFILASSAGVLAHVASIDIPLPEVMIASSVLVGGLVLLLRLPIGALGWTALAIAAGFFHGFAFGETVVGAEQGVIGAYLAGLAVVALIIAMVARMATQILLVPQDGSSMRLRAAGAVLACIGGVFLNFALFAT